MKILVTLTNLYNSIALKLDCEKNEATLNGKQIKLNVPIFSSKLLSIVSSWDNKMINDMVLDGISYSVEINKDGKRYKYEGRNDFPDNYNEFISLLRGNDIIWLSTILKI